MKLILCVDCSDIFKLDIIPRKCKCGKCGGQYLDHVNATYYGDSAIPIGLDNYSLVAALKAQPEKGLGREFNAFVIPKICKSMKKEEGAEPDG